MTLLSTIAIVGRPNVGKSTLFNRLAGQRIAVVHEMAGVTRDTLVTQVEREGRRFYFVDTGGISTASEEMEEKTTAQALEALNEAGHIIFLTDVRTGVTDEDLQVAKILRRHSGKVWLLVNKAERKEDEYAVHEFHSLGLGEPLPISALHGDGILDLWDRLLELVPEPETLEGKDFMLRLAVVGRPNVGKSSIVNALLGEERMIVSEIPGTTRDAVDSVLRWHGHDIMLVDTAGLRRRSRVKERLEAYSNMRSLSAIDESNVVLMVLDASRKIAEQDVRIAAHAHDEGKGIILCVNKWDLVDKDASTTGEFVKKIHDQLGFLSYAPILFISANTKQRIHQVLETAWRVYESRGVKISTGKLNNFFQEIFDRRPPNFHAGGTGKAYYSLQVSSAPPTFVLFVNKPEWFAENYKRYLVRRLREEFGWEGSPIRLRLQGKEKEGK